MCTQNKRWFAFRLNWFHHITDLWLVMMNRTATKQQKNLQPQGTLQFSSSSSSSLAHTTPIHLLHQSPRRESATPVPLLQKRPLSPLHHHRAASIRSAAAVLDN